MTSRGEECRQMCLPVRFRSLDDQVLNVMTFPHSNLLRTNDTNQPHKDATSLTDTDPSSLTSAT
jgi:hypothetical protein